MSASHEYSTTGGIEYDDRGKYREDKKVRKSHIVAANQRAMEMPINRYQCRSRECHATNAIRVISV